ncbi:MAG: hydroxyacid dehydrogenase [Kiritimatiellae bacterium]|nr:hydroxyacid dehydrogenase [Kiritimatiellia bacterium]
MRNLIVVTPQSTVDALLRETDRRRLESLANVTWCTAVNRNTPESEYLRAVAEARAEIIMTGWGSPLLTPAILDANPQVKYVVNLTGELKRYVHRKCLERGLLVTNWGDIPAPVVAEAALMMTLASLRRAYYRQIQMHDRREWPMSDPPMWTPQTLFDKTVGLYGFGLIAREYVKMLKPFGVRILVFTGWITPEEQKDFGVERVASLKELFARSDVVAIHTGNRPDTYHSVNAEVLALMKDGGHIINTARGPIIDEAALAAELRKGRLFAALDVFEVEPLPPDHPFRGLPNCLLFPHDGGPTEDYRWRCGANAVDQVERYLRGEPLKYVVTLGQYDRMT